MKIAFIGAGNMAVELGKRWAGKGHKLFYSYSRDHDKLQRQAASIGSAAKVGSPVEVAKIADIIVLATPYQAAPAAIKTAGDLSGKVLWSIINPFKEDFSGLQVGLTTSGAEELVKLAPDARFVAAIPPFAETLQQATIQSPAPSVFVYSSDAEARAIVLTLIKELGVDGVDAGAITSARFFEPAMMGLMHLAYGQSMGSRIGLRLLRNDNAPSRAT
ncbi:MAG TPA: NAD(P)-binding domain-containing protein [Acidisarcina sp.]